ncbi:LysM domain-containing protein [Colletotrichum musicola]|uniref:LysM domain-containing protein n=1 Tax=Colletotrichum musicola TaxID=2175873 RepID=A0A8H6NUY7_9PEZI|nr:LysM domain-containing protein [Colletotrichum musicola]
MAGLLSCPAEVIVRILSHCHGFPDVLALVSTCKQLHSLWENAAPAVIRTVAQRGILAFDDALMAANIGPIADLSATSRRFTISELAQVMSMQHLVRCLEHMFFYSEVQNGISQWTALLQPRPPQLIVRGGEGDDQTALDRAVEKWKESFRRSTYRLFLVGAALAHAYNEPFLRLSEDKHGHFEEPPTRESLQRDQECLEKISTAYDYKTNDEKEAAIFEPLSSWLVGVAKDEACRRAFVPYWKRPAFLADMPEEEDEEKEEDDDEMSDTLSDPDVFAVWEVMRMVVAHELTRVRFTRRVEPPSEQMEWLAALRPEQTRKVSVVMFGHFQLDEITMPARLEDADGILLTADRVTPLDKQSSSDGGGGLPQTCSWHIAQRLLMAPLPLGHSSRFPGLTLQHQFFTYSLRVRWNRRFKDLDAEWANSPYQEFLAQGHAFTEGDYGDENYGSWDPAPSSKTKTPYLVIKVENTGQAGTVELQDLKFTVRGKTVGAIILQWNMRESSQGSAAMWDVHIRVGGAAGSDLQVSDCPKLTGSVNPKLHCRFDAGTPDATIFNDLDINAQTQIDIYVAQGVLIESTNPVWIYGTASEHCVLYQFQTVDAANIFMGIIQTESPYFQDTPRAPAPFGNAPALYKSSDPNFDICQPGERKCAVSWAIRLLNSHNIYIYGAGLYSWFDNYAQACVNTEDCQKRIMSIETSSDIWIYSLITKASIEMISPVGGVAVLGKDNNINYCDVVMAWLGSASGGQSRGVIYRSPNCKPLCITFTIPIVNIQVKFGLCPPDLKSFPPPIPNVAIIPVPLGGKPGPTTPGNKPSEEQEQEEDDEDNKAPVCPYTAQYADPDEFYDTSLNNINPFDPDNYDPDTDGYPRKDCGGGGGGGSGGSDPGTGAGTPKTPKTTKTTTTTAPPTPPRTTSETKPTPTSNPVPKPRDPPKPDALDTFCDWANGRTVCNNQEAVEPEGGLGGLERCPYCSSTHTVYDLDQTMLHLRKACHRSYGHERSEESASY